MAKAAPQSGSSVAPASEGSSIVIGTIFHIFTNAAGEGDVSDDTVAAQLAEMNAAYAPYFSFELLNITRTADDALYPLPPWTEGEARKMLRVGTMQHLNVYVSLLENDLLGYADMAFPWAPFPGRGPLHTGWVQARAPRRTLLEQCCISTPCRLWQAAGPR